MTVLQEKLLTELLPEADSKISDLKREIVSLEEQLANNDAALVSAIDEFIAADQRANALSAQIADFVALNGSLTLKIDELMQSQSELQLKNKTVLGLNTNLLGRLENMEQDKKKLLAKVDTLEAAISGKPVKCSNSSDIQLQKLGNRLNAALARAASEERKRRALEEKCVTVSANSNYNPIETRETAPKEEEVSILNHEEKRVILRPKLRPPEEVLKKRSTEPSISLEEATSKSLEEAIRQARSTLVDKQTKQNNSTKRGDYSFGKQVSNCWLIDPGSSAANVKVTIAMEMQLDGKVVESSIKMIRSEGGNQSDAKMAFQLARRALLKCQRGGYELPKEKYELWRNIEITFDPSAMRKR